MSKRSMTGVAGAMSLLALSVMPALAEAAPTPNKADTVWMMVSTILVLLMTIPGLALFYGGLVRSKNMLSVLTQVLATVCLVSLIWVTYGHSLAFTAGGSLNDFVGGFDKMFLKGVTPESTVATFSNGVVIPELV
ncbi:MAG: ammonia channel protein, partial [Methylobacterium sp.]|nr:ammonia channel protein [Methylobacterium sp.]